MHLKQPRESNYEALRICAMLMVLLVHADFLALKIPSGAYAQAAPGAAFLRIAVEMLSIASVNIFIMISGYFSIRPSARSVASLLFLLIFWRVLIEGVVLGCGIETLSFKQAILFILPGYKDWFVQNYLLLVLLAPAANALVEKWGRCRLRNFLIISFAAELVAGWLLMPVYDSPFNRGYSVVSFLGLYLLARYIRLYIRSDALTPGNGLLWFVGLGAACSAVLWLSLRHDAGSSETAGLLTAYSGIPAIPLAAIAVCAVRTLSFRSRIVNSLACSAFVIYLVHFNPLVINHFISACHVLYRACGIWAYFPAFLGCAVIFYAACWTVDRIRVAAWAVIARRFFAPA